MIQNLYNIELFESKTLLYFYLKNNYEAVSKLEMEVRETGGW